MLDLDSIEQYFEKLRNSNVIIYGAGSKGKQAVELLKQKGIRVIAVCDSNKQLWGNEFVGGIFIENLESVKERLKDYVILLTVTINNALEILQRIKADCDIFQFCNPYKVEIGLLNEEEIESHKDELYQIYESLCDQESKVIFQKCLFYKATGNMLGLVQHISTTNEVLAFFDEGCIQEKKDHVYVDIGAYTGDSIESFALSVNGQYKKIIAFEGDEGNYLALKRMVQYTRLKNVEIHKQLLWSERSVMEWHSTSDNSEINYDSPNLFTDVDMSVDNKTREKMKKQDVTLVRKERSVSTLDECIGDEIPTLLKINALAADFNILKGGRKIITKYHPTIIMEFGVMRDDVFRLVPQILSFHKKYKIYLREKKIYNDIKTILYAIGEE